jgi:hypothetical protein
MNHNCHHRLGVASLVCWALAFNLGFMWLTGTEAVAQDSKARKPSTPSAESAPAVPQAKKT